MDPTTYQICPSASTFSVWSFAQLDIRDRKKDLEKDAHISASNFMYIVYNIVKEKESSELGLGFWVLGFTIMPLAPLTG